MAFRSGIILTFALFALPLVADEAKPPQPPIPPVMDAPKEPPTKPGDYKYKFITRVDGRPIQMTYVLILPKGYDTAPPDQKFPMVVFIHGSGEVGTDGEGVYVHGPASELRYHPQMREHFPFIVLCPQCPPRGERWDQPVMYKAVSLIVDAAIRSVHADPDRVYMTGLSMGGKGTWLAAMEGADRFAAIAPMCSGSTHPEAAQKLKYVAVWMIDGADDPGDSAAAKTMQDVLKNNLAEVRNTLVPHVGHGVWPEFYASDQFYEWLLTHKRPTPEERRAMDAAGPFAQRKQEMPHDPGHHRVVIRVPFDGQTTQMICSVYVPKTYTPTGSKKFPVLLFLHEEHTIGTLLNDVVLHGPEQAIEQPGNEALRNDFPFVVISPTCPVGMGDWAKPETVQAVLLCLDQLTKAMNVDPARIYATGLNEGGAGVWHVAATDPKRFAAIAPIIAKGPFTPPPNLSDALKNVPNWTLFAQSEQKTEDTLKSALAGWKAENKLTPVGATTLEEENAAFAKRDIYDWLLKQKK